MLAFFLLTVVNKNYKISLFDFFADFLFCSLFSYFPLIPATFLGFYIGVTSGRIFLARSTFIRLLSPSRLNFKNTPFFHAFLQKGFPGMPSQLLTLSFFKFLILHTIMFLCFYIFLRASKFYTVFLLEKLLFILIKLKK